MMEIMIKEGMRARQPRGAKKEGQKGVVRFFFFSTLWTSFFSFPSALFFFFSFFFIHSCNPKEAMGTKRYKMGLFFLGGGAKGMKEKEERERERWGEGKKRRGEVDFCSFFIYFLYTKKEKNTASLFKLFFISPQRN